MTQKQNEIQITPKNVDELILEALELDTLHHTREYTMALYEQMERQGFKTL